MRQVLKEKGQNLRRFSGNESGSANSGLVIGKGRSGSMVAGIGHQDAGVINNDPVNRSANQLGSAMAKIQNYSHLKNGEKMRGMTLFKSQTNLNGMSQAASFLTP